MRKYTRVSPKNTETVPQKAALLEIEPADSSTETAPTKSQEPTPVRRKKKKNFGVANQRMAVPHIPGYVTRWRNDVGGRIQQMLQNDWEFVDEKEYGDAVGAEIMNTDLGTRISMVVGTHEDGSPERAYLMKIREEWYEEDQKEKQAPLEETDRAIYGGRFGEQRGDNRYIPSSGINIE